MSKRLTGRNPLAYLGVEPLQPTNYVIVPRAPTTKDLGGFNIGDEWENSVTQNVYKLVSVHGTVALPQQRTANWVLITGGIGDVITLTGNVGGVVPADAAGNINILGAAGQITVTGTPGTNTLTISSGAAVATSYVEDFGVPAVPALGVLNILGGASTDPEQIALVFRRNIHTSGAGNTVSVKLNDSLSLPVTNAAGTAGVVYRAGVAAANRWLHSFGVNNTFLGLAAGNLTMAAGALRNIGIGDNTLLALTTGAANTGVGFQVLNHTTTGSQNTCVGHASGEDISTSNDNTAVGYNSLNTLATGIGSNVAIGFAALRDVLTGIQNICIGALAGVTYTGAESSNIIITSDQFAALVGESNTIRLGSSGATAGLQNRCFIGGIRGITTGVNDAIAVLIDSAGQLGTVSSSERFKENIEEMGDSSDSVLDLNPVTFNYKADEDKLRQYGLIAEEVEEVMPNLVVYDADNLPMAVKYHELPVLLLNEIQKLYGRVSELENALKKKKS